MAAAATTVLVLAAGGGLWWLTRSTPGPGERGEVRLTLSSAAQETGLTELANNRLRVAKGAVVAIEPTTGALLAAVSTPAPEPTAAASGGAVLDPARRALANGAFSQAVAPGDTFGVVVSAAVLSNGLTPASMVAGGDQYQAPGSTIAIRNRAGVVCPSQVTLERALAVSCTTVFARLCPTYGATRFASMAQAFGFEERPRADGNPPSLFTDDGKEVLRTPGSSTGTMSDNDKVGLAQACVGQRDVRMTPLQGALVAAAVANDGRQMRPYLVQEKRAADRSVRYTATPQELHRPVTGPAATGLRDMMINAVDNGTARAARISGVQVGGKTGIAEDADQQNHGWFIGFATNNGKPVVAVAVLLQSAGRGASAEAARIAAEVMKAVIAERG